MTDRERKMKEAHALAEQDIAEHEAKHGYKMSQYQKDAFYRVRIQGAGLWIW